MQEQAIGQGVVSESNSLGQRIGIWLAGTGLTVATLIAVALSWTVMWWASVRLSPDPARDARIAAIEAQEREAARLAALGPPGPALDLHTVARGQRLYAAACLACHGDDGRGKPNLGKDLVDNPSLRRKSDEQFAGLVIDGRAMDDPLNTTKVPMPARGGRMDFDDGHINDIVAYLRALQDPRRVNGTLPEVTIAVLDDDEPAPAAAPAAAVVAVASAKTAVVEVAPAVTATTLDAAAITRGKKVYSSCIACHGKTGAGVPKMGADLIHSDFVKSKSDAEMLAFLKKGRQPGDPDSKLKLAMPAKGGNPALKDNQLADVVVYLRSLQSTAGGPAATPAPAAPSPAAPVPTAASALPASSAAQAVVAPAVASGDTAVLDAAAITRGKKVYSSCIACHGKTGAGVAKMGADLIHSDFVKTKSDAEMLAFLKKGRQPGDPDSKLKLAMPAKGGNPALKDNQLSDVIVYLRSLQQAAADKK